MSICPCCEQTKITICEHYSPEKCGCLCEPSKKREDLAAYAHDAWSGWMEYMFSKCKEFPPTMVSGNDYWFHFKMPRALYARWIRQMSTEYHELPESERESDRKEAEKMIEIMCSEMLDVSFDKTS